MLPKSPIEAVAETYRRSQMLCINTTLSSNIMCVSSLAVFFSEGLIQTSAIQADLVKNCKKQIPYMIAIVNLKQ